MISRDYSRRDFLRLTGASAAAVALGACAPNSSTGTWPGIAPGSGAGGYSRVLSRGPFVAPRVGIDRVVRNVVGLRPFRPSGFVVRAEQMGDKLVVHNYGHGGGGITLSWGSAHLAVREAGDPAEKSAAILGCGVMGLSTARLLQDRGWDVTIYAKALPPHTTSDVAGGLWGPTSVYDDGAVSDAFMAQFAEAARVAHHAFQGMVGSGYGVSWIEQDYLGNAYQPPSSYIRMLPDLYPGVVDLEEGEHPFPVGFVRRVTTMMIEPALYLPRLMSDVRGAGGSIQVRDFQSVSEVLALAEPVVFNCTGLGAGALFGDDEIMPIKGQLAFLPPDPLVDYATIGGGSGVMYMFPRADGILLGGTFERGVGTLGATVSETERIVRGHEQLFTSLR